MEITVSNYNMILLNVIPEMIQELSTGPGSADWSPTKPVFHSSNPTYVFQRLNHLASTRYLSCNYYIYFVQQTTTTAVRNRMLTIIRSNSMVGERTHEKNCHIFTDKRKTYKPGHAKHCRRGGRRI